jgi:hypothetical protein
MSPKPGHDLVARLVRGQVRQRPLYDEDPVRARYAAQLFEA